MNPEIIGLHLENHHLKKLTKGGTIQLNNSQLHNAIVSMPTAESMLVNCYVHIEMVEDTD